MTRSKQTLIACAISLFSTTIAHTPPKQEADPIAVVRNVDLAICLDTSGSMEGLIDSARQSIWAIVNDLALAQPTPNLRIALMTFGNDGHKAENGWVKVDLGLTNDLDEVSRLLFAQKTNGGTEYVGRVVKSALDNLEWTTTPGALKLIVVAGNESADQDQTFPFRTQCSRAIGEGIMINSIYCGNPSGAEAAAWREVASLADGQFHAIDQNGTVALQSPFDKQISSLSISLNKTYVPYGTKGKAGQRNQIVQDKNAVAMNSQAAVQRAQSKAGAIYNCSWDLVDMCRLKQVELAKVEVKDLPANMQKMTLPQRQKHLDAMGKQRDKLRKEITLMGSKRSAWAKTEMKKRNIDGNQAFEHAVRSAVRAQAEKKGLIYPKSKAKEESKAPPALPIDPSLIKKKTPNKAISKKKC